MAFLPRGTSIRTHMRNVGFFLVQENLLTELLFIFEPTYCCSGAFLANIGDHESGQVTEYHSFTAPVPIVRLPPVCILNAIRAFAQNFFSQQEDCHMGMLLSPA